MKLSDFIRKHRDEVIRRWSQLVTHRLALNPDTQPQLINDIPELLKDLLEALDADPAEWTSSSARAHARQRIAVGVDIGGLSEEISMVGEVIVELAAEDRCHFEPRELARMLRVLARGTAQSVTEYARLRDQEFTRESARHFSFVAHELRTPLQTAHLATGILAESTSSPMIDRIQRAHDQLTNLIDTALVDARLTAEPSITKERTLARDLAQAAVENATAFAEQKGIRLVVDADEVVVEVDRRLMVSALTNLLINGVKFSGSGEQVMLRIRTKQERVHFEVEDSCGGLSDEDLPKLFKPFAQAGKDRSGFGLGLMIVKQAAEAQGGAVRVVGHQGLGCSFIIELPRFQGRLSRA